MKFSIIIPIYNSEKFLHNLLHSILKQTYTNYELILVDDGSTDDSLKIMEEYAENDKRIKIISKKNEGPGLTRKRGFKEATGNLIFFVDSDDTLYDEKVLQKIASIYQKEKFEILFFNYEIDYGENKKYSNCFGMNIEEGTYSIDKLNSTIVKGSLWAKIFVKEKLTDDMFYNSNNFEDVYTSYKYLENCNSFYYLNDVCYCVNRNDNYNSLTRTVTIKKIISSVDIILDISKNKKLIGSKRLLAFDIYIHNMKNIIKNPEKNKKECINHIKKLRKVFAGHAFIYCIKYFSIKRLLFYYYTLLFC